MNGKRRGLISTAPTLLILLCGGAIAQTIQTIELSPRTTCLANTVTVAGTLSCANAVLDSTRIELSGFDLSVELYFTQALICLPAVVPYEEQIATPILVTPGLYHVDVENFVNHVSSYKSNADALVDAGSSCPVNLDCESAQTVECNQQIFGTVPAGPGDIDAYGCDTPYAGSGEAIYELRLENAVTSFSVELSSSYDAATNVLSIFFLDACDENACLAFVQADLSGSARLLADELPAGSYYLVVDGHQGRSDDSQHSLVVSGEGCGVSLEVVSWGEIKSKFEE